MIWIVGGAALLSLAFVAAACYFFWGLAKAAEEHRARNGGML